MSLQVWLPLNGDLTNYGLSDVSATLSGLTEDANGKIGKCYASSGAGYINSGYGNGKTIDNLSICCWFKFTTIENNKIVFGSPNGSNQRCYLGYTNNNWCIAYGGTSWSAGNGASLGATVNVWQHLALTINNKVMSLYINGEKMGQTITSSTAPTAAGNIFAFDYGAGTSYRPKGMMNDFRIYDHALSPKEVKEISKALVLHYRFSDIGGNNNLLKNTDIQTKSATSTTYSYQYKSDFTPASVGLKTGDVITFSVFLKSKTTEKVRARIICTNATANRTQDIFGTEVLEGISEVSAILTADTVNISLWFSSFNDPISVEYSHPKLEKALLYDSNIYTEPDGSTWIRVAHQNNPTNNLFRSTDTFATGVYIDANRWFQMHLSENISTNWEYMIKQKATSSSAEEKFRWIQTNNPMLETSSGTVTKYSSGGYIQAKDAGLYRYSSNTYLIGSGTWWGAVGCYAAFSGGIPGYNGVTVTSGYLDVYMRLKDNFNPTNKATPWMPNTEDAGYNNLYNNSTIIDCGITNINDGMATNVSYSYNTPRNSSCIFLNGANVGTNTTDGASYIIGKCKMPSCQAITFSWWAKIIKYGVGGIIETTAATSNYTTSGDYNTTALGQWDNNLRIYNGTSAVNLFNSIAPRDKMWHLNTITFDGQNVKGYLDGQLVQTSALTGSLPAFNAIKIGLGYAGGVNRQIQQYVSDLRIYATALSGNDILELYHTAALIDNGNNIMVYEFKEI